MKGELIRPAPLGRRLAAAVYDSLLVIALWFLVGFIALLFTHGEAVPTGHPLFSVILFGLTALFFIVFWTHGGQTLGMKTWKMKLLQKNGEAVTWTLAFIRFISAAVAWAAAGVGFLWSLIDPEKRTWHDIASNCVLIDLRHKVEP